MGFRPGPFLAGNSKAKRTLTARPNLSSATISFIISSYRRHQVRQIEVCKNHDSRRGEIVIINFRQNDPGERFISKGTLFLGPYEGIYEFRIKL